VRQCVVGVAPTAVVSPSLVRAVSERAPHVLAVDLGLIGDCRTAWCQFGLVAAGAAETVTGRAECAGAMGRGRLGMNGCTVAA
jgi:hypothetical protein